MHARKQDRQPRKPHRPPKPTTTTAAPAPPPPPPSDHVYVIRIYDYTDIYSKYVVNAMNYYRGWMAASGHNITVDYHRMDVMDADACWAMPSTPDIGIRMCERIGSGTAGSTGMNWQQTGPTSWALHSMIEFGAYDWDYLYGCATCGGQLTEGGDYLACHELGHSTGNLPHRAADDLPYSCMSVYGGYAPATLTDTPSSLSPAEQAQILAALPGETMRTGMTAASFVPHWEEPPSPEHHQEARRRRHERLGHHHR